MTPESESGRDPLEALASEFIERQRSGERPTVSEYTSKYPDLADEIGELFPTIAAVERLKIHKEHSTNGRASLGPVKLERLGDFRIIREIGRGGMGIVFEAEQESLARRVAIKVLPGQALLDPGQLKRFEREARIAAGLHHTNIVPVIGVGEQSGFHYIVMQYIRGVGLDQVIKSLMHAERSGSASADTTPGTKGDTAAVDAFELEAILSRLLGGAEPRKGKTGSSIVSESHYWKAVARIGAQAADALHYGHTQGTIHRDIKPANLLLDTQGVVWITDFGVAKAIQDEGITRTADVTGTLRYIAPERFHGQTDARSDLYSLGLTLHEMLTLQWAYNVTDQHSLTMQILNDDPPPPRRINPRIPRDLETIVRKATMREPDHRYASAGELAADLERFLEDRPIEARRITSVERIWFWCRRNPVMAGLASAVLILLIAVAIVAGIGYVQTKEANLLVSQALDGEKEQREKAETTSGLALDVLDRIYTQLAPARIEEGIKLTVESTDGSEIEIPVQPTISKETAALLENLLVFYDRLAEQGGNSVQLRRKRAQANHRVGTIQQHLGHYEPAKAAFLRALDIYEELVQQDPGRADLKMETARIHNELGQLYRTNALPKEGREAHSESLRILEELSQGPAHPKGARYELARTYSLLGSLTWRDIGPAQPGPTPELPLHAPGREPQSQDRSRPPPPPHGEDPFHPPPGSDRIPPHLRPARGEPGDPAADGRRREPAAQGRWKERYLQKAIVILTELLREAPSDPSYRYLLGLCYRDGFPGMPLDQGVEQLGKAARIFEDLVDEFPDVPEFNYGLCETYAIWDVRSLPDDLFSTAEKDFEKALGILETLVMEHPHVPSYLMSRIHILHKSADICRRTGRGDLAETKLEQALTFQRSLSRRFPDNSSYMLWTAEIQRSLARLLNDLNRLAEVGPLLEDSAAILANLMEKNPDQVHFRLLLIECYMELGDVLQRMGEEERARGMVEKARELRQ